MNIDDLTNDTIYEISDLLNMNRKVDLIIQHYKRYGKLPSTNELSLDFKARSFLSGLKIMGSNPHIVSKLDKAIPNWRTNIKTKIDLHKINIMIKFYQTKKRLPKENEIIGDGITEFLGRVYLRKLKYLYNELPDFIQIKLDENMPEWKEQIKQTNKGIKFISFIKFYQEHQRLPGENEIIGDDYIKFNGYDYMIKLKHNIKSYSQRYIDILDEIIPNWREEFANCKKLKKIDLIIEFYKQNNRLPRRGEIIGDQFLNFDGYLYFKNLIKNYNINLSIESIEKLDKNIPNWRNYFKLDIDGVINELIRFHRENKGFPKENDIVEVNYRDINLIKFISKVKRGKIILTDQQKQRLIRYIPTWEIFIGDRDFSNSIKLEVLSYFYNEFKRLPELGELVEIDGIFFDVGQYLKNLRDGRENLNLDEQQKLANIMPYSVLYPKGPKKIHF
jgi:uncharacterized protein YcbK (DUF882 family)